MILEIFWEK